MLFDVVGAGYTIEGQKTGEEKFGGLQLEITPAYRRDLKSWYPATEQQSTKLSSVRMLDENTSPLANSLRPGDMLRVHPRPLTRIVPLTIYDLVSKLPSSTTPLNVKDPKQPIRILADRCRLRIPRKSPEFSLLMLPLYLENKSSAHQLSFHKAD